MASPAAIRGHEGSRVRSRGRICLISALLLPVPFQFTSVGPALWMSSGSLVIDQRASGIDWPKTLFFLGNSIRLDQAID